MDDNRLGKHISQVFNEELEDLRSNVMAMGGLVEEQVNHAVGAFLSRDTETADNVIRRDHQVNRLEVQIDEECTRILAKRQPAASDLRMIIAVIKTITDLERIGDEAEKIAHITIHSNDRASIENSLLATVQQMGELAAHQLHDALDAFARLDTETAVATVKRDTKLDDIYSGLMRQTATFVMEDPRNFSQIFDVLWSVRALERIGDHAKNICEYVIFLVKGKDIRHTSIENLENAAR